MSTVALPLQLFAQFMLWSLLSVGGAMGLLPDMHRTLVDVHHWISDAQFNAAVALGQSAPGPSMMLFSTICGWQAGGLSGALLAPLGLLLPSTLITLAYLRYSQANPHHRWLQAIRDGLAPLTVGLLLSSGWLLAWQNVARPRDVLLLAPALLISLGSKKLNPLWLLLSGALIGALGLL